MPKRKQRRRRGLHLHFPVGGLDESRAYQQQKPYTTPDCLNVWPFAQLEEKARGGSRPGLKKAYAADLGDGINMMAVCSTINTTTGAVTKHLIASEETGLVYIEESGDMVVFEGNLAREYDNTDELLMEDGEAIALETSAQTIGKYTPLTAEYIQTATLGQKIYIADYSSKKATGTDGTVTGQLLNSTTYDGSWNSQNIDALSDVAILTTQSGSSVTSGVYYISKDNDSANLNLTTAPGNGATDFEIVTGIKVLNPATKVMSLLEATTGTVPHGCRLIAGYRDRLVLAGAPSYPHLWYMSRQGTYTDWRYGDDPSDLGRAMYGDGSGQQETRNPLTALIPRQDSYLLFCSETSIEVMRGDPAAGGEMYTVSETVGCIDKKAWCEGPDGEIFFLSRDGLYNIPAGPVGTPQSMSREKMPQALRDIDVTEYTVILEYDVYNRGIVISANNFEGGYAGTFYWFDIRTKSYWPMTMGANTIAPRSLVMQPGDANNNSRILWGGDDGYIRYLDADTKNDDGTAFSNYVIYGPIAMGGNNRNAMITEIVGTLDESSDDCTFTIVTADSAEKSVTDTHNLVTGTWVAGRNGTTYPRQSGGFVTVKVTGQASKRWATEDIYVQMMELGRHRVRG